MRGVYTVPVWMRSSVALAAHSSDEITAGALSLALHKIGDNEGQRESVSSSCDCVMEVDCAYCKGSGSITHFLLTVWFCRVWAHYLRGLC